MFSRLLASSSFHDVLCKDRSNSNLIDFSFWTVVKPKPTSDLVLPRCSLWCRAVPTPAPPGTPMACSPLVFQDTFAGSWDHELLPGGRKGTQQGPMGETGGVCSQTQCGWGDKPSKLEYQKPFLVHLLERTFHNALFGRSNRALYNNDFYLKGKLLSFNEPYWRMAAWSHYVCIL